MSVDPHTKTLDELARLRSLHAESTDPLAVLLLREIIAEIEVDLGRADSSGNADEGA